MDRIESLHGFQFDRYPSIHEQVEPVAAVLAQALVTQWQWMLPLEGNTSMTQLAREALFTGRLEQTWPEGPMHLGRRPDDFLGESIETLSASSLRSVASLQ